MTIKRVVDKPKTQIVKEFPEFDSAKRYIADLVCFCRELKIIDGELRAFDLETGNFTCRYKDLKSFLSSNITAKVFMLKGSQDLARFIMGCREFPIVREIEETVNELAEDEVSVDDSKLHKIYAFAEAINKDSTIIRKLHTRHYRADRYSFIQLDRSDNGRYEGKTVDEAISLALGNGYTVYQFDTQEEFLRWGLEQVTGKKFTEVLPLLFVRNVEGYTCEGCQSHFDDDVEATIQVESNKQLIPIDCHEFLCKECYDRINND